MKSKHLLVTLTLFAVSNLAFECGVKNYLYYIDNQYNKSIFTYEAIGGQGTYPDTTLLFTNGDIIGEVHPKQVYIKSSYVASLIDWVKTIPSDTLSVYIFSQDTLDTYSWQEIQEGYKVLRRYDLSIEDLEALNCTIPYPPTERMKNMKMYPPYKD